MRPALLLFILLVSKLMPLAQTAPPIGQWREHLPYHQSISIEQIGNTIWSATPYSLFSVDLTDNSIERLSKVEGLSESGIRTIGSDASGSRLVIAYKTGNLDIVGSGGVINITDILRSQLVADKTINQVYSATGNTWLAGNEGIYLLNTSKNEISDTYIIGTAGKKINVYSLAAYKNMLYAATSEGVKSASLSGQNLSDFRNWKADTSIRLLNHITQELVTLEDKLYLRSVDTIFILTGNTWLPFHTDGWKIRTMQASAGKILLNESLNSNGRVLVISAGGVVEKTIANKSIVAPAESLIINNAFWTADSVKGLSVLSGSTETNINPGSPADITLGDMRNVGPKLVTVGGAVNADWEPSNRPGLISIFSENDWKNYQPATLPALNSFPDIISTAIDPVDQSVWAGSFGGGLLHLNNNGTAVLYKVNSFIRESSFAPGSYRVAGLRFDQDNNLWISNYGADQNLVVRKPDGTTRSIKIPFPLDQNASGEIIIDDLDQKWIIVPKGNGLICFNHGASIDNSGDDLWKWYRTGQGNGNLPDNNVLSLARDKDGFIWIGTKKGIAVIRCAQDAFTTVGCEAFRPIVQQDNFAGYLFSDEEVQAIAIDGANRKWVGTKKGLWLLSEDGEKIIYRFSASNSPLPSDDIRQVSIDAVTGEVFVATTLGIVSFRSTATEPEADSKKILVFPNPVPPSYTGTIAIRGITEDAIVKITELNGNLVFQTRALGGQAIWNGRDYKGRQISTGVYLVLITDQTTREQVSTKIVFINK